MSHFSENAPRSGIGAVIHWFKAHMRGNELNGLDPVELELMARDLNIPADDLVRLAAEESTDSTLMRKMMTLHGLDYDKLRAEYTAVIRDMELTCSRCVDRKLCQHDLSHGVDAHTCDQYCPNADTMKALAS